MPMERASTSSSAITTSRHATTTRSVQVGLRVDRDGLASLNLNGDRYYYTESQYSEGYDSDYGSYFHFYQDDDELTIYKDGSLIALWSSFDGTVTFYYHDYFYI